MLNSQVGVVVIGDNLPPKNRVSFFNFKLFTASSRTCGGGDCSYRYDLPPKKQGSFAPFPFPFPKEKTLIISITMRKNPGLFCDLFWGGDL